MIGVWSLAFLIAIVPLLPFSYFTGEGSYYGRSGVCLSIYLTNEVSYLAITSFTLN